MSTTITCDLSRVIAIINMTVTVVLCVGAIFNIIADGSFQSVIVQIYAFIAGVLLFFVDISMPVICSENFAFVQYFWGRGLSYLPIGCVVFRNANAFQEFAGIFGIVWAFILLVGALIEKLKPGSMPNGGVIIPFISGNGGNRSKTSAPSSVARAAR